MSSIPVNFLTIAGGLGLATSMILFIVSYKNLVKNSKRDDRNAVPTAHRSTERKKQIVSHSH